MKDLVSVVMATYKEDVSYVRQAIESILSQTWKNIEFIIINDSPDDEEIDLMVRSIDDRRIIYLRNNENKGLAYCLNRAIRLSKGEYIARMDADDLSVLSRLEKQVDFLKNHPHINILGTWAYSMDLEREQGGIIKYPVTYERIKASTILGSPMCHPSVMFRRCIFSEYQFYYNEDFKYTQDYEFWVRLVDRFEFYNLPEPLLYWRNSNSRVSSKNGHEQDELVKAIHRRQIEKLGIDLTPENLRVHYNLYIPEITALKDIIYSFFWILKLIRINQGKRIFPGKELGGILAYHYRIGVQRGKCKYVGLFSWVIVKTVLILYH
jgi:glycosyltransferase involved in cell wall biosynthesis